VTISIALAKYTTEVVKIQLSSPKNLLDGETVSDFIFVGISHASSFFLGHACVEQSFKAL